MEEDFNDDHLFTEQAHSFEESSRYGECHGPEKQFSASGDDSNDQHFLEEFKARDEEFLSLMRNYEHLIFKNGVEEARSAAMELCAKKQTIKKSDIVSMFAHAGGWKVGAVEEAELVRAMGHTHDDDVINASRLQEFLLSTSVGKNAANHAFQPKLRVKLLTVIIDGLPMKTSLPYVNSLCSEHGLIQEVKVVSDSGAKHAKQPPKFSVTFADEQSALRAVRKLNGFSSKRIPGPVSCRVLEPSS
jgi:hypothetical protein